MTSYKSFNVKNYVPLTKMCKLAFKDKYAIPQFNPLNHDYMIEILKVCQELKSPVILGISGSTVKYMGTPEAVVYACISAIKTNNITIPVALHLDHGGSVEACKAAVDGGFSSVMYDGSALPLEENIKNSKIVADYAHKHDASFECEVGIVGGVEDGVVGEVLYAKTEDCEQIVNTVHPDVIAASLGSVHGHYKGKPNLATDRMHAISSKLGIPLVLHGGSGIPDEMIKRAIANGEAKINIGTDLKEAFYFSLQKMFETNMFNKNTKLIDLRKMFPIAFEGVRKVTRNKIMLFGSNNRY